MPTVCVDWNGVLDMYNGYKGDTHFDPPRPGVAAFLQELRRMGYKVVVLTTRRPQDVWRWLRAYNLHHFVDNVTDRKVPAIAYIDDRALLFRGDFDATLEELRNFKTHWQKGCH